MKKFEGQFEKEDEELLRTYIKEPWFIELNDLVSICDLSGNEESILQNIKDYIWNVLAKNRDDEFANATKNFLKFLESYTNKKEPCFKGKSDGSTFDTTQDLLEVSSGYHISIDVMKQNLKKRAYATNGLYSFASFIGTDHTEYLAKRSMESKGLPVYDDSRKQVDFNPIMAQCTFEYFDEPVAGYFLVHEKSHPFRVILSKNFLETNQELVHFKDLYSSNSYVVDDKMDTYVGRIQMMESNIKMRYKNLLSPEKMQELLDKLKLQYCKQEFMKLVIGPMDCNLGNTALILTNNDDKEVPEINLSPAYDLDLSFNLAQIMSSKGSMSVMETSDGKVANINSFIKEFKDVSGFEEFLSEFYRKIENINASREIVDDAIDRTNFTFFIENSEQYIGFLNERFEQVRKAYRETFIDEKGDEEHEAILE